MTQSILITGFGPYPGVPRNPSLALIEALARRFGFETAELPVEYHTVDTALQRALEEHAPGALLMTGLRPCGHCLNLERVALNLDDADKPDNAGVLRNGEAIDPQGPPAYISPLPLGKWCELFIEAGVPAKISNHAGAYICNRVYYHAQTWARIGKARPTLFLHLPWIGEGKVNNLAGKPLTIEALLPPVVSLVRDMLILAGAEQSKGQAQAVSTA